MVYEQFSYSQANTTVVVAPLTNPVYNPWPTAPKERNLFQTVEELRRGVCVCVCGGGGGRWCMETPRVFKFSFTVPGL